MVVPYERSGRVGQKTRTRAALVAAARELLASGVTPTVEQAAEAAGIARTTAYRYFPNRHALLVATYPEIDADSLMGPAPPEDAAARLDLFTERFGEQLLEHEPELRAMLRVSLETPPPGADGAPLRQGRAIGWIEDALEPLREELGSEELRRLAVSIRAAFGIEALVWLTDVAGLSRPEAIELMRGSARSLLRSAQP
jgi:AcrR family transcriptional regulator